MSDITREEFNGLGGRLTGVNENLKVCQAEKNEKIKSVEKSISHIEENVERLFIGQDTIKVSISGLQGRIIGAVSIIGLLAAIIAALIGKFL